MADLKIGTTVGGSPVWCQGNLPLTPTGNQLLFKNQRIYSTLDKPTAAELGVVNKSGDTMTGSLSVQGTLSSTSDIRTSISGAGNFIISGNSTGYAELVGKPKDAGSWNYSAGLRFYPDNTWRIGDKKIYFEGNKPTAAELGVVNKSGDTMTGSLSFNVAGGTASIIDMPTSVPQGQVNYLRRFRGGSGDAIWHESAKGTEYKITQGGDFATATDVMAVDNRGNMYLGSARSRVYTDTYRPNAGGLYAYSWATSSSNFDNGFNNNDEVRWVKFSSAAINAPKKSQSEQVATSGYAFVFGDPTNGGQVSFGHGDQIAFRSKMGSNIGTWNYVYSTANKPTANDLSVVSRAGDSMTGPLKIGVSYSALEVGSITTDSFGFPVGGNNQPNSYVAKSRSMFKVGKNALHIIADGSPSVRRFGLQVGSTDNATAADVGTLELNPVGGAVRTNGAEVYNHDNFKDIPQPDFHMPLNDDVRIRLGYGDEVQVGGYTVAKLGNFTRNSIASYFDKSGNYKEAAVNEPRFERDGLLLETSSANLIDGESRTPVGIGGATAGIVTGLGGKPFHAIPADYTQAVHVGASSGRVTDIVNGKYTFSIFANSSRPIRMYMREPDAPYTDSQKIEQVCYGWWRHSVTWTISTSNTGSLNPHISAAQNMRIGMFQIEQQEFASSYIPFKGTRAMDTMTLPAAGNLPYMNISEDIKRTVYMSISNPQVSSNGYCELLNVESVSWDIMCRVNNTSSGLQFVAARASDGGCTASAIQEQKNTYVYVLDGNKQTICANGSITTRTSGGPSVPNTSPTSIVFNGLGDHRCRVHVKDLRMWHHVLPIEQIKRLN